MTILLFIKIIIICDYIGLIYLVILFSINYIQLIKAIRAIKHSNKKKLYLDDYRYIDSENMIPVSVIIPSYNERNTIVDNIKNVLCQKYKEYEIIVINDGSTDDSMEILIDAFGLVKKDILIDYKVECSDILGVYMSPIYHNLIIVDKVNGGKSDALNAGINISKYPVYVALDADSILEKDALLKIVAPFIYDNNIIAVGGIIRISSGCVIENGEIVKIDIPKSILGKLQVIEYLRSFFIGRISNSKSGRIVIISGAFGAFRKESVILCGGYTKGCIGEDMELVLKLHENIKKINDKYKIEFLSTPVCWTQPPENIIDIYKQRKRWQIGLVNSLLRHKKMFLNPEYGMLGLYTIPFYWVFEFFGPILESIGYLVIPVSYFIGILNLKFMIIYLSLIIIFGTILSLSSIIIEMYSMRRYPKSSQILVLILVAIIDNFGFRQLNALFRLIGVLLYPFNKDKWGKMKRKEFEKSK